MSQERLDERTETTCPRCAVGCRLRYDEATGRATGVEGARVNREGRLCPKGIAAFEGLDEDRLTTPLVRRDGDLESVSWEEALDRVASGIERVRERHGPDALAFFGAPRCTNEENYLLQKIARSLGTNNADNRARSCHDATAEAMEARLGSGGTTNSLDDLAEADVFLVAGANPAERQPIAFDRCVRPAVNDGAALLHLDPRANRTTRLATQHLAPHPGRDALAVALLVRAILDAGLEDRAFVAERTTGFDAFARSMERFDVAADAERAGLDPAAVREAAETFGEADRAAVVTGTGIEDDEGTTPNALLDLLLVTGNLGKRGVGMNPFRGLVNEQGASDMGARPDCLPGEAPVSDADARARVAAEWGVEPPAESGRSEPDLVREFGSGVRGAFVLGENPAVNRLDDATSERLFADLDFLAVQDVAPNETTAFADVVLPASAWAEKEGTVTNLDRQVQALRPAASPPGRARRDFDVLADLGARLTDIDFEYDGPPAVFDEMTRVNPLYAGMEYEGVLDGGERWPFSEGESEGQDILHRKRFRTGRQRAPLEPIDVAASGTAGDDRDSGDGDGLVLLTESRVDEDAGSPSARREAATVQINPADAATRDIVDGAQVAVESDRGTVTLRARCTDAVREGTVFAHASVADPLVGEGRTPVEVTQSRLRE
ncbi:MULTISPECIES: molybdopterin oxidoreductase family protein [Halococcus]|uniref:Formate dehydrogenase alpha subunit n=1 Tax=Halococcus salifodinae DSM 8989 TaxID=1227456 RepID=M0NDM0_9EURY|nr:MULTISPECIES: molybdopterin-dependent oxidoreductase [Halococcus]EMA55946.1 formate dehydrogenase alpha subunit [Halococcus salifodinae DSM 8989]